MLTFELFKLLKSCYIKLHKIFSICFIKTLVYCKMPIKFCIFTCVKWILLSDKDAVTKGYPGVVVQFCISTFIWTGRRFTSFSKSLNRSSARAVWNALKDCDGILIKLIKIFWNLFFFFYLIFGKEKTRLVS